MTTRFLTSCISSRLFTKNNETLYDLHSAVAADAKKAFFDGVEVAWLLCSGLDASLYSKARLMYLQLSAS